MEAMRPPGCPPSIATKPPPASSALAKTLAVPWLPAALWKEQLALDAPLLWGPMNAHVTLQFVLQRTLQGAIQHSKLPGIRVWATNSCTQVRGATPMSSTEPSEPNSWSPSSSFTWSPRWEGVMAGWSSPTSSRLCPAASILGCRT